ncbi:MAG: hypothetical protein CMQ19_13245 [Gammaproteobacteria bacterium]|nr:hypothetical protein [Gammaproteobacteria bacterium]
MLSMNPKVSIELDTSQWWAALAALLLSSTPALAHEGHLSSWTGAERLNWRAPPFNKCAVYADTNANYVPWKTANAEALRTMDSLNAETWNGGPTYPTRASFIHDYTVHQEAWMKANCPWIF